MAQIIQFKPNTKQPEKPIQQGTTHAIIIPPEIDNMVIPGFVYMTKKCAEIIDIITHIQQNEYNNDIDNGPFAA